MSSINRLTLETELEAVIKFVLRFKSHLVIGALVGMVSGYVLAYLRTDRKIVQEVRWSQTLTLSEKSPYDRQAIIGAIANFYSSNPNRILFEKDLKNAVGDEVISEMKTLSLFRRIENQGTQLLVEFEFPSPREAQLSKRFLIASLERVMFSEFTKQNEKYEFIEQELINSDIILNRIFLKMRDSGIKNKLLSNEAFWKLFSTRASEFPVGTAALLLASGGESELEIKQSLKDLRFHLTAAESLRNSLARFPKLLISYLKPPILIELGEFEQQENLIISSNLSLKHLLSSAVGMLCGLLVGISLATTQQYLIERGNTVSTKD